MNDWKPEALSPLALAFIGDAVWEVYVRNHVMNLGLRRPSELHRKATHYVKAKAQAHLASALWDDLTDDERAVLKRGRNAKSGTVRKNADILDYRHSTGFEALIGYLYGRGDDARLDDICRTALTVLDQLEG